MSPYLQELVNAQGEINRAVFLANVQDNRQHYPSLSEEQFSDEVVLAHAELAMCHLQKLCPADIWSNVDMERMARKKAVADAFLARVERKMRKNRRDHEKKG